MQVVCFFGGDKSGCTLALCGRKIYKIRPNPAYGMKSDTSQVTQRLDNVNCVTCLRLRVKQLNGLIDKTIDRIEELESVKAIR